MLFLSCFCYLFIDALWSTAGKWLASWPSFVMSNCEDDTFPFSFDPYLLYQSPSQQKKLYKFDKFISIDEGLF